MKFNRFFYAWPNVAEVDVGSENKSGFIKIWINRSMAKAFISEMLQKNSVERVISMLALCWHDKTGVSFIPARKSLYNILTNDILEKYSKKTNYSEEEILLEYNNYEYWNVDIVKNFLNEEYLSEDDIKIIKRMLSYEEIALKLLSEKNEL